MSCLSGLGHYYAASPPPHSCPPTLSNSDSVALCDSTSRGLLLLTVMLKSQSPVFWAERVMMPWTQLENSNEITAMARVHCLQDFLHASKCSVFLKENFLNSFFRTECMADNKKKISFSRESSGTTWLLIADIKAEIQYSFCYNGCLPNFKFPCASYVAL